MIKPKFFAPDLNKTASKKPSEKMTEATVNLIGNKISNNITKLWKTSQQNKFESETEIPKERCIFREKGQHILDKLR